MTKFEELMDNKEFVEGLEKTGSYEEVKTAFKDNGVDLDEELALSVEDEELSEDALEGVAGGLSAKDMKRLLKRAVAVVKDGPIVGTWKFSTSCGVLLRAYYDLNRYGDATRSYSEKEIMKAAKYIGCE